MKRLVLLSLLAAAATGVMAHGDPLPAEAPAATRHAMPGKPIGRVASVLLTTRPDARLRPARVAASDTLVSRVELEDGRAYFLQGVVQGAEGTGAYFVDHGRRQRVLCVGEVPAACYELVH